MLSASKTNNSPDYKYFIHWNSEHIETWQRALDALKSENPRYQLLGKELKGNPDSGLAIFHDMLDAGRQQLQDPENYFAIMPLTQNTCETITTLLTYLVKIEIKLSSNSTQTTTRPDDFKILLDAYLTIANGLILDQMNTLIAIKEYMQSPQKKNQEIAIKIFEQITHINTLIDIYLEILIALSNTRLNQVTDTIKTNLVTLISNGWDIYSGLDVIKMLLIDLKLPVKVQLPHKYSREYLFDQLNKHQGLTLNRLIEIKVRYCEYVEIKNQNKRDEHFEALRKLIKDSLNSGDIEKDKHDYFLQGITATQASDLILRLNLSIEHQDAQLVSTNMAGLLRQFKTLHKLNYQSLNRVEINHESLKQTLNKLIIQVVSQSFIMTVTTINLVLNQIDQMKSLVSYYQTIAQTKYYWDQFHREITRKIQIVEENACTRKEQIESAEKNAQELAQLLDEQLTKYHSEFDKIAASLNVDFESKIKEKPKVVRHSQFTPPSVHANKEKTTTDEPGVEMKASVAELAREFFSNHPPRDYQAFLDSIAPEDTAEAKLYVGDYFILAAMTNEALEHYEQAHTLALKATPPHKELIENIGFSLQIAHEQLKACLAQNEKKQKRFEESRAQYIQYLGYYCIANLPTEDTKATDSMTQSEYEKHVFDLGLNYFKEVGEKKKKNNLPFSRYVTERKAIETERNKLIFECKSTRRLLDKVEGKQTEALTKIGVFKPGPKKSADRKTKKRHAQRK